MPKILTYNQANPLREVEIPYEDGSGTFTLQVRRTEKALTVETIADTNGRIATATDVVRESGLSVQQIRDIIQETFTSKRGKPR